MKRRMTRFLCGFLTVAMLGGCGTVDEASLLPAEEVSVVASSEEPEEIYETLDLMTEGATSFSSGNQDVVIPPATEVNPTVTNGAQWGDLIFSNAPYVLVYNPNIYTGSTSNSMASGDFSNMILHNIKRADGLEETEDAVTAIKEKDTPAQLTTEDLITPYILEDVVLDGKKADVLEPIYQKGDTHDFYYGTSGARTKGTFKCVYAGEHCYIWSIDKSITEKNAKAQGKVFDQTIYPETLEYYGQPRFTENGGKVNILYYDMSSMNYGGFFSWQDIYASTEISAARAENLMYNTDHAMIHICSHCGKDYNLSTLAHEVQHLVVASDWFFYKKTPYMASWLNEAMSANAEELYQDGIKDTYGAAQKYYNSEAYRNGQSLYNFKTDYANDTGTYGVVYLFQEYMTRLAGEGIFSKIHTYWRTSMSKTTTEAESLMKSVPEDVRNAVDEAYYYDEDLMSLFKSDTDVWMSKLTLNFYISTLSDTYAKTDIYAKNYKYNSKKIKASEWQDVFRKERLYLGNGQISIEGGGCLLVATSDGNFYQPANADSNLIYVALDRNFQPIASNLKDPDSFYWNKSRTVTVITDEWTVENNAQQVMYNGITDTLYEYGFGKPTYVTASTAEQKIGEVRNILKLKTGRPGVIILTYNPTKGKEEEYTKLLAEAHQKGILVITAGPCVVDEENMKWGVHFDHTNLIDSVTDFYTFRAGTGIHSLGESLASFGLQIINREADHHNLYYN